MTGISETQEIDERALVKSMPDGLARSLLPEPWQTHVSDGESPYPPETKPIRLYERLAGLFTKTFDAIGIVWGREAGRGLVFLLLPVFAGCGALIYFTLSFEPYWLPLLSILTGLIIVRILVRAHFMPAQILTLVVVLQLGLIAGKVETERRATQMLGSEVSARVTGRVVALEYRNNESWRVTLDLLETERPKLRYAPQRIRITARDIPANTTIGSGLNGFARLRVASGPVRPGNYDFAFHAYFSGIGANGFFLGTPKLVAVPEATGMVAKISERIATLRIKISERIAEVLSGENGSVAAALIAGERAGISEETNEDLRKSGLAHILSISGLHMALAAGVVMLSLRSLFALFPAFSQRHPVKKYAAFLSLLSCTFYLAMSGADVAAQRSYVMIVVMLCALLVDHAAISMRNLAIAAIAMIAISPHEILGPSFQMSFSATAALIAAFAWWSDRRASKRSSEENDRTSPYGLAAKIFRPALATAGTSMVAGLASGIFAAYHFNNTAPLGLVGNVLALPVISILVMPFAVLSLLLMPLQLDWLPLQIMGFGVSMVRQIAGFVANISPEGNPGAIPVTTLLLWTAAVVIAVIFTTRLRWLALPFIVAGFIVFIRTPLPDILISEDAKLIAVRLPDGNFAVNHNRPPKFTAQNWQTAYLIDEFIPPQKVGKQNPVSDENAFICEEEVCSIPLRDGRMLAYSADESGEEIACNIGDLVILAVVGKVRGCGRSNVLVIGKQELALKGTLEIRLGRKLSDIPEKADSASDDKENGFLEEGRPVPRSPVEASEAVRKSIYGDELIFAVGTPVRPWHLHRLYSRPARGLPEREYKRKSAN
ncbi:ComEC family competence protein [Falsochrobactrum sp. TDYN1]|uniref:ComEC family competence protein n=1 Tax=Falsochrobactrum tianjinense TaxID=2706015 RepID=A0A949PNF7_9HYPH|nr:ComEC/Rec2 family competence protein [Falsochrobactrum sp. TDYN1]MBV2144591.1 ComEC family competence protein [Falsochrobactrum sp. TDYN1]